MEITKQNNLTQSFAIQINISSDIYQYREYDMCSQYTHFLTNSLMIVKDNDEKLSTKPLKEI